MNEIELFQVGELSISLYRPEGEMSNSSLALWLPYLGGDRMTCKNELRYLASKGFHALSVDPFMHGARDSIKNPHIAVRVFSDFRAKMWEILGFTTLDCMRIIDWAREEFRLNESVVVGGFSMGGDIALALAGADKRVCKISTVVSSPDWLRAGMTDVMDSTKILEQGMATECGSWLYSKLNPMTNLKNYSNRQEMLFLLGEKDTHINPSYAVNFKEALLRADDEWEDRVKVRIVEGENHISLLQREDIVREALDFLVR